MFKDIAIAATLAIVSSAAMATDVPSTKFYAGADIGTTKGEGSSDRESGFGVFGGYQFTPHIAIEAGYRRLVDQDETFAGISGSSNVDQLALSAVGTLPVGNGFSVFGRLGVNRVAVKGNFGVEKFKDSDTRGLYGIGVAYSFSPSISARVELQKPHSELTNLSAGVSYKF
ncbi:MAG: porin family protein [Pseudomonadota bacterium]